MSGGIALRGWHPWAAFALVLAVLPLVFPGSHAISLLSLMGSFSIVALSYNLLLGQAGMLSFGHAVYAGLGAYAAIHLLARIGQGLWLPVALLPLAGGLAAMAAAMLLGWLNTRRGGLAFAMISLALGELVATASPMLPTWFGGEGGISANRAVGPALMGLSFGPAIEVYALIAAWLFASALAMHALARTPLGVIANAVRDNEERARFIGYDPRRVRWMVMVAAGFFAGVGGALSAINFEIVTNESLGSAQSGAILMAVFVGGTRHFFGPVLGAVVYVLMVGVVGGVSQAWLLYLGLLFMLTVLHAPQGLAGLLALNLRRLRAGPRAGLLRAGALLALASLVLAAGVVGLVESAYGLARDGGVPAPACIAGLMLLSAGGLGLRRVLGPWREQAARCDARLAEAVR